MRDLFIILTIIAAASAFPLPSAQYDMFSESGVDAGYDSYGFIPDDSSQSFLLAGSDTGNTNEGDITPSTTPPQGSPQLPAGFDPEVFDGIPWSIPDGSWTGSNRPSHHADGQYITPEEKFRQGEKGEDYEGNYGGINPDIGGPTSFELSPEDTAKLIEAGSLVVGGITWVYNAATGTISWLNNAFNGFTP